MSYTYQDYLNYYKNNNILSDPNFEDNMICVVDVPSSFNGPNSLKFVKCKNFLDNNHSYQITIARSSDLSNISNVTKNPTPYDFYAVMPKTYRSPAILNDSSLFTKLTISEIPKSFLKNYLKNMTHEQKNILAKKNWTDASNIYCKYQPDYNSCMKTFMDEKVADINSKNNIKFDDKSDTKSDDKNNKNKNTFFVFIIFFILILSISVFLSLKYIRKQ